MKSKWILVAMLIIALSSLIGCSDTKINDEILKLNNEIEALNNELQALREENEKLKTVEVTEAEQNVDIFGYIKDIAHIPLYFQPYGQSVPAFGPIAQLNAYAIDNSQGVKILEKGEDFTLISVEGYIPSWLLSEESGVYVKSHSEMFYVKEDIQLYIDPVNQSISRDIGLGVGVKTLFEDGDYYYIRTLSYESPNSIEYGWIKKSALGKHKDVTATNRIAVMVPKGTEVYVYDDGVTKKILSVWSHFMENADDIWGYLNTEENGRYTIILPGLYPIEVDKENVVFIK